MALKWFCNFYSIKNQKAKSKTNVRFVDIFKKIEYPIFTLHQVIAKNYIIYCNNCKNSNARNTMQLLHAENQRKQKENYL